MEDKNGKNKSLGIHMICIDEKQAEKSKDKMENYFYSVGLKVRNNLEKNEQTRKKKRI